MRPCQCSCWVCLTCRSAMFCFRIASSCSCKHSSMNFLRIRDRFACSRFRSWQPSRLRCGSRHMSRWPHAHVEEQSREKVQIIVTDNVYIIVYSWIRLKSFSPLRFMSIFRRSHKAKLCISCKNQLQNPLIRICGASNKTKNHCWD